MFQSISWQAFLSTVGLIVGGYYAISALLLYSEEIKSIFVQKRSNAPVQENGDDQTGTIEPNDVMGKVKYMTEVNVPHEISIDAEEILVGSKNEIEEPVSRSEPTSPEDAIIKSVADLLKEIASVLPQISPEDKEGTSLIFKSLLSRYEQLTATTYQDAISIFIQKAMSPVQFDLNEIKMWWAIDDATLSEN